MILEYKKNISVALNYDAVQNMIMFDNLVNEGELQKGAPKAGAVNVPDGTYRGMQFQNGVWVDKGIVMRETLEAAPVEVPRLDRGSGNKGLVPPKKVGKKKTPK